ncbi:hypothetical protein EB796_007256 [Bugula neritina]|uniref:Nose resistant-to-fluoxetine protein N-terminal domain-containing protein n=1 Tax=Bugula neritina TaxID=10212 RepID=A0A7J7K852_BUGNE|nr:hypothetical protein EB796_007256 [Bugula neritina]
MTITIVSYSNRYFIDNIYDYDYTAVASFGFSPTFTMTKTDLIFTLSLICCLVVRVNTSGQSQPMFTLRPDKAARFFAQQASLFYDKGNNGQTPAVKELLAAAEARNHLEEILLAGAKYLNADAKSRQAEHRLDSNKSVPSDLNLSNMCGNQTLHLLNGVSNGSMWALQTLDAWGKPPTGFFTGILNWVGDYQECIAIKSTYGKNDDPGMMLYQGRYCSGIHPSMAATGGQNVSITYQLGMCIPSGCDEHDAIVFYNTFLQYLSPESLDQTSVACQPLPGEKEFRPLTIFAYFLVCLIALISLSAGVYDYAIHGTLVYYKIHRLAVPPHLLTNGNIQTTRPLQQMMLILYTMIT